MSTLLAANDNASVNVTLSSSPSSPSISRIFDVDRLGVTTYFLALIYLFLTIYALRQNVRLRRILNPSSSALSMRLVDARQLLPAFAGIHCLIRTVAFGILAGYMLAHEGQLNYRVEVVLFTAPEIFILSTYVLLYCQWLEVYVSAHDQFVISSMQKFRRNWIIAFIICTTTLYIVVCALYILLALRTDQFEDSVVQIILYFTAISCLVLPVLMMLCSLYFGTLLLSGFSYSSEIAKRRVERMNRCFVSWTIGRVCRGALLIVTIAYHWQQTLDSTILGVVTVTVLLLTEVIPLLATLDWQTISMLIFTDEGSHLNGDVGDGYSEAVFGSGIGGNESDYAEIAASSGVGGFGYQSDAATVSDSDHIIRFPESDSHQPASVRQRETDALLAGPPAPSPRIQVLRKSDGSEAATTSSTTQIKQLAFSDLQFINNPSLSMWSFERVTHPSEEAHDEFTSLQLARIPAAAVPPHFTSPVDSHHYESAPLVVVQRYDFSRIFDGSSTDSRNLLEEIRADLLQTARLHHPHVHATLAVLLNHKSPGMIYHVSQLATGGNLYNLLHGSNADSIGVGPSTSSSRTRSITDVISPRGVLRVCREIAEGMVEVHRVGLVHGNLKSSVILFDEAGRAQVNDASLRKMKNLAEILYGQRFFHPAYASPELLASAASPSIQSDVYAFAIICWEVMTKLIPFAGKDMAAIYAAVVERHEKLRLLSSNETELPPTFSKLIAACWSEKATDRPTFVQIVKQLRHIEASLDE